MKKTWIIVISAVCIIAALLLFLFIYKNTDAKTELTLALEYYAASGPLEDLVNDFNDTSDNYHISIIYYGSRAERSIETLAAELENHTAPDLIAVSPDYMKISDQYTENLVPYFDGNDTAPHILPALYEQLKTEDDAIHILPLSVWIDSYVFLGDETPGEEMYLSVQGAYGLWYLQTHFGTEYAYDPQRTAFTKTGLFPSIPPVQINADSENKTAAWEFVKYALGTEAQTSLTGYMSFPVTEDAFRSLLDAAQAGTVTGGVGYAVEESSIEKIRALADGISDFRW